MYLSHITIPRLDSKTFAQLEVVAPGITGFPGVVLVETAEAAVELASSQLRGILSRTESLGGVESLTETATGWDIVLKVKEFRGE